MAIPLDAHNPPALFKEVSRMGLTRRRLRRWPLDLAKPVISFDATFWWIDDDGTPSPKRSANGSDEKQSFEIPPKRK